MTMLSRPVRLGTPWSPGWKHTARPALGQLVTSWSDYGKVVVARSIGTTLGTVVGTVLGSVTRLLIPAVQKSSKNTRVPYLVVGGVIALIGTFVPLQSLPIPLHTLGGLITGLGVSGFIVGPEMKRA
jgi:hypothetical protein